MRLGYNVTLVSLLTVWIMKYDYQNQIFLDFKAKLESGLSHILKVMFTQWRHTGGVKL